MTEDITDPDRVGGITPKESQPNINIPDKNAFKEEMDKTAPDSSNEAKVQSPMQAAQQQVNPSSPATMDSVHNQMNGVSSSLGDIKTQLHTKPKLKHSDKTLLRKKLGNANDHIKSAAKHVGADVGNENFDAKLNRSKNPIARFLSMVSDGQQQMVQAAQSLKNLNSSGKQVEPGQLLMVQVKLQKAQQELSYTSTILSNATSMVKTLFSTQI